MEYSLPLERWELMLFGDFLLYSVAGYLYFLWNKCNHISSQAFFDTPSSVGKDLKAYWNFCLETQAWQNKIISSGTGNNSLMVRLPLKGSS